MLSCWLNLTGRVSRAAAKARPPLQGCACRGAGAAIPDPLRQVCYGGPDQGRCAGGCDPTLAGSRELRADLPMVLISAGSGSLLVGPLCGNTHDNHRRGHKLNCPGAYAETKLLGARAGGRSLAAMAILHGRSSRADRSRSAGARPA